MLYIIEQGPLDSATYTFTESPDCSFGFTTTFANNPTFSTPTKLGSGSGKLTLESADPNHVWDYTVTVTATLDLHAFEKQ